MDASNFDWSHLEPVAGDDRRAEREALADVLDLRDTLAGSPWGCDFCRDGRPARTYPARRGPAPYWLACTGCDALIRSGNFDALLDRSVRRQLARDFPLQLPSQMELIEDAYRATSRTAQAAFLAACGPTLGLPS
jgi:hypothetical protein